MIDNEYGLQVGDCLVCYVKSSPKERKSLLTMEKKYFNTYIDLTKISQNRSYE
jgi:hypothetical protein